MRSVDEPHRRVQEHRRRPQRCGERVQAERLGALPTVKNALQLLADRGRIRFVREIADIITVMHMGKLLAEGPISEIETNARVREVYLGTEGIH